VPSSQNSERGKDFEGKLTGREEDLPSPPLKLNRVSVGKHLEGRNSGRSHGDSAGQLHSEHIRSHEH
jgi:hypothetical protein